MKDRPFADERADRRPREFRSQPIAEYPDQDLVRLDVAQVGVVAQGQRLVDDRQPRDRIRRRGRDRTGHLAVDEAQQIERVLRLAAIAAIVHGARAAAVERGIGSVFRIVQIGKLENLHGRRDHRGQRRRHVVVLCRRETDGAGGDERVRLVEIRRPAFVDAGHRGRVQGRRHQGVRWVGRRSAVKKRAIGQADGVTRSLDAGPTRRHRE